MLHVGLRVHRAHLDGAELGVRADVVPEVRVIGHHAGLDHEVDAGLVVGPVLVVGRDPHAREGAEHGHPGRRQAGLVRAPVRRVRADRLEDRHVHAHPVADVDRLLRVVHAHVDVQPVDDLLARDEAQRGDQLAVAGVGGDALLLPQGGRMRAGGADREAPRRCRVGHLAAQPAQVPAGLGDVLARRCRDLQHRLQQLGLDLALTLVGLDDGVDLVRQGERLPVEDHQLFLDAERVARPGELGPHGAA
jgi:hypothetical protein